MPNLYIISGANGSGKTTTAKQILLYFLNIYEHVSADEIAAGLSPFKPESVAIQVGKVMLKRLDYPLEQPFELPYAHQIDFANEIVSHFDNRTTQGAIGGINQKIKLIKGKVYGLTKLCFIIKI